MIGFYEVSSNVEHIIEKGPGEGAAELDRYIEALNKLYNAQKYFEKNIPQSVELINVVSILTKRIFIFDIVRISSHLFFTKAVKN